MKITFLMMKFIITWLSKVPSSFCLGWQKKDEMHRKNIRMSERKKKFVKGAFYLAFLSLLLTRIFIEIIFLHSPLDVFIVTRLDLNLSFFPFFLSASNSHQITANFQFLDMMISIVVLWDGQWKISPSCLNWREIE